MIIKNSIAKKGNSKNFQKGYQNEKDAAYHINFHFANSENYAVFHDITVEFNGRKAQIDHLVIGRLGVFVLESKFYSGNPHIDDNGNWTIYYGKKAVPIPSPVKQNENHIVVLKDIFENGDILPKGLLGKKKPPFFNFVLISTKTKKPKNAPKEVISADQIKEKIIDRDVSTKDMLNLLTNKTLTPGEVLLTAHKLEKYILPDAIPAAPEKKQYQEKPKNKPVSKPQKKNPFDLEELKKRRYELAKKNGLKPYMVFSNKELEEIAKQKPKTKEEALKIKGVGETKYDKYWSYLIGAE